MPLDDTRHFFWLDRDYTLLRCQGYRQEHMQPNCGRVLWDAYPDARPVFEPFYETVWERGWGHHTFFFRGCLLDLTASTTSDELCVAARTLTLEGLRAALVAAEAAVAQAGAPPSSGGPLSHRAGAPCHLRAV